MRIPTRKAVLQLFAADPDAEDLIYDMLDARRQLEYPGDYCFEAPEYDSDSVTAEVRSVVYCSCCRSEHEGSITLTKEEVLDELTSRQQA